MNVNKTRELQESGSRCFAKGPVQVDSVGETAVQSWSAGESAESLTLFRNEVGKQVVRDFSGYDPKEQGVSYVEGNIVSNARLDA